MDASHVRQGGRSGMLSLLARRSCCSPPHEDGPSSVLFGWPLVHHLDTAILQSPCCGEHTCYKLPLDPAEMRQKENLCAVFFSFILMSFNKNDNCSVCSLQAKHNPLKYLAF